MKKRKTYLTTLTDHPKFFGSELSVLSKDDRISWVSVFESALSDGLMKTVETYQQASHQQNLAAEGLPATKQGSMQCHRPMGLVPDHDQLRLHRGYRVPVLLSWRMIRVRLGE